MKLTKKQTSELLHILNSLEAVQGYIARKDIAVMGIRDLRGCKIPGNWYSEQHKDKEIDGPYMKFVGSNLALLPTAIRSLRRFINGSI